MIKEQIKDYLSGIESFDDKVNAINELRELIHSESPFKNEPVDYVKWVKSNNVTANDYNPNKVAPPEMELLEVSIMNDGYTQPIVTWPNTEKNTTEVIDGFHRSRVGKESKVVNQRVKGYLPVVDIRKEQAGKNDRIASTIRHNRARGKHQVNAMSEIVIELKNRNWSNKRIAKQLGMDEEEVLRLCQVSGLEHLFTDKDFSKAWEASDTVQDDYELLTDEMDEGQVNSVRTANTNDSRRIFHTYDKWECHKAGFYATKKEGMNTEKCEIEFARLISDNEAFSNSLKSVTDEWVNSCEHYLTNKSMNRIAWLGQAAVCYATGIPSKYSKGFALIPEDQQKIANNTALNHLNEWLARNDRESVSLEVALGGSDRQVDIY